MSVIQTSYGPRTLVRSVGDYLHTTPTPSAPHGEWWRLDPQSGRLVDVPSNSPALRATLAVADSPKPKAKPDVLYHDDNGAITCGACAGSTLKYTLRTLSGHRARPWTTEEKAEFTRLVGEAPKCECCGNVGAS